MNAVTLYSRVTMNVDIGVLNFQKCNQCLKVHKSLWCSKNVIVNVNVYFGQVITLIKYIKGQKSLRVLYKYICHCYCLFVGQAMCPHLSDQMSQKSKVPRVAR